MDADDFEFPPDQIEEDLPVQSLANEVPLSALVSTPVDQLPPTNAPTGATRSLRQTIRGASARHQQKGRHAHNQSDRAGTVAAADGNGSQTLASMSGDGSGRGALEDDDDEFALEPVLAQNSSSSHAPGALDDRPPDEAPQEGAGTGAALPPIASSSSSGRLGGVRRSHAGWTDAEVQQFYTALSQYGTDFAAISILFPEHTREEVKRLYHRELRRHQNQVRQALANKQAIDLDAFSTLLHEKEKKERKPTKELNMDEEEMLSRIALGAASPPPAAGENTTSDADGSDETAGKKRKGKAGKRPRTASAKDRRQPREGDGTGGEARGAKRSVDEVRAEKTFYEMMMMDAEAGSSRHPSKRNKAEKEPTFAESALAGEFDFDDMEGA